MNVNDLLNVGSGILNDVSRAVETGNFDGLGERTKERVNFAVSQFTPPDGSARSAGPQQTQSYSYRQPANNGTPVRPAYARNISYQYRQPASANNGYFLSKPQHKAEGILKIVGGITGCVAGAIGSIVSFSTAGTIAALGTIAGGLGTMIFSGMGIAFASLFFISAVILNSGVRLRKLIKHYYEYGAAVGNAEFFNVSKLAELVGDSVNETTKNLERMIRKNLLPGARFDRKKTTIMLTNRAYEQYQAAEASRIEREANAQLRGEPAVAVDDHTDNDVKRIIDDGNRAILQVRAINDEIPDTQVMSDKLYRLEEIMKRIFEQVRKDPSSASDLRRFMDYYLPTTTKLLTAYVELDRQPVQGDNIKNTKAEIENSLDTINDAFEQLLDGMFSDMALDISSDISVMKTMMAQDGLAQEDPFAMPAEPEEDPFAVHPEPLKF
ncbi:MAG: 5-bromo-4-chloroindolyl phosphate hydrolysis family protein [Lachnospiraceae bacterium]|nr:5-bromo-4-chloroindolyl phosphate hydrolysis family protein [Lachnospiraceae bacterium]